MPKYIMRLDDACEKRDIEKWDRMENLLERYSIQPLVGVIPHCEDPMMEKYGIDNEFWDRVYDWINKGWTIAMHGYNHVYNTDCGGINPVNMRSEFAGNTLAVQRDKIAKGISIFRNQGINPKIFFAPSHTFDFNTIIALKQESDIKIISDTIAIDSYHNKGITFIPQQSGRVRWLPFRIVTFCYHPNTMDEDSFIRLEIFLKKNSSRFIKFPEILSSRKLSIIDKILRYIYFLKRKG